MVEKIGKGEFFMDFDSFDMSEIEQAKREYAEEAEARWGGTEAYQESARRTSRYDKAEWAKIQAGSNEIMASFITAMASGPSGEAAQRAVEAWRAHIGRYFYPCGTEMLRGLGEMYISDERFTRNLDRLGEGLAAFMHESIQCYCARREAP